MFSAIFQSKSIHLFVVVFWCILHCFESTLTGSLRPNSPPPAGTSTPLIVGTPSCGDKGLLARIRVNDSTVVVRSAYKIKLKNMNKMTTVKTSQ